MGKKTKEKPVFCWHYEDPVPDYVFLNDDVVFVCVGIDQLVHALNIAEVLDVVARNHPEACVI